MPMHRRHIDLAGAPAQYVESLRHLENALKKARGLRNKGPATDDDVEEVREALDLIVGVIDRRTWEGIQ